MVPEEDLHGDTYKESAKYYALKLWSHARLYSDWLKVTHYKQYLKWLAVSQLHAMQQVTAQFTKSYRMCMLRQLLKLALVPHVSAWAVIVYFV